MATGAKETREKERGERKGGRKEVSNLLLHFLQFILTRERPKRARIAWGTQVGGKKRG